MSVALSFEICIVGGGPAGLATAIALRQSGHNPTVIDRAVPPLDKACGEGLMPDGVVLLERLGIRIPNHLGFRFSGIRFSDSSSSVVAEFPARLGLGLRRTTLHTLLLDRAAELGISMVWGAKHVRVADTCVTFDGQTANYQYVIAADGQNSQTRKQAGLDSPLHESPRYGFCRHYRTAPWSPHVEVFWGADCQLYVTPIATNEISVALLSSNPQLRLVQALAHFPQLASRLAHAEPVSREIGGLSVSRKFRRVTRGRLALAGDASGSVDAVTGDGLCLSFKQAFALAQAIDSGRLENYQRAHDTLARRPRQMSSLLLTLDKSPVLRRRALASLAHHPGLFSALLAIHTGDRSFATLFSRQLLGFFRTFLNA